MAQADLDNLVFPGPDLENLDPDLDFQDPGPENKIIKIGLGHRPSPDDQGRS